MKYVFGPVPSRRLGLSLGIDPLPFKTCNWNCIYCQLGRTSPLTMERGEYVPRQDLIAEVKQVLTASQPGELDWITFVGSGEPTLHGGLGWMIRQVKAYTDLPVAVITNGSLLYLPEVREELSAADAVLPTLDAGNSRLYHQINRAAPRFSLERLVDGIDLFRRMYSGKIWIEVMLIKDMNDNSKALHEIALHLKRLKPDGVHITLPIRPPAEVGIQPADDSGLMRAKNILGEFTPVSIPNTVQAQVVGDGDLCEKILNIVTRHPMQEDELQTLLKSWSAEQVHEGIKDLNNRHLMKIVELDGSNFWTAEAANFHKKRPNQPGNTT